MVSEIVQFKPVDATDNRDLGPCVPEFAEPIDEQVTLVGCEIVTDFHIWIVRL